MTKLKIIGLALACFLAGWLFGSNPGQLGSSSTGRWLMTGPEGMFLLNTRTGDVWMFGPEGFQYLPKPPTRPYQTASEERDDARLKGTDSETMESFLKLPSPEEARKLLKEIAEREAERKAKGNDNKPAGTIESALELLLSVQKQMQAQADMKLKKLAEQALAEEDQE